MPAVKVPPPADLIAPCSKLPEYTGKDLESVFKYSINIIKLYKICSAKQSALAKVAQ